MTKPKMSLFAAGVICLVGTSMTFPASVRAGTCPYGGDSSQAMRCFDCMKRVWTGTRWKMKNTCNGSGSTIRNNHR